MPSSPIDVRPVPSAVPSAVHPAQLKGLDWDDLRVFLCVCRTGALAPASRLLGMDHSTTSRRLRRLEKAIGRRLFERTRAGLSLTEAGQRVRESVEEVGLAVEALWHRLEDAASAGAQTVRLAMREGVSTMYVGPALTALRLQHPQIVLEITHSAQVVSFAQREADLFLSFHPIRAAGIYTEPLGLCDVGLFGAPGYLDRRGRPRTAADLATHDFVDGVPELSPGPLAGLLRQMVAQPTVVLRSVTMIGQYQAALAEVGLVAFPVPAAARDGRLERVLPALACTSLTMWLSRHESLRERQAIKAVVAALRQAWTGD
jgi:DNA-binding transcriptional LysR family regulator